MATAYEFVMGTKPNVTSSAGETSIVVPYPASTQAGDILVLLAWGRNVSGGGHLDPTVTGESGGQFVFGPYQYPSIITELELNIATPIVAVGTETGSVTVTKNGASASLRAVAMVKYDAFTYDAVIFLSDSNDYLSEAETETCDDGTVLGYSPTGEPCRTLTMWHWGTSDVLDGAGFNPTQTYTPPDTEAQLFTAHKDGVGNPSNSFLSDYDVVVSDQSWADDDAALVAVTATVAGDGNAVAAGNALRIVFTNTPAAVILAGAGVKVQETKLHLKVFPNKVYAASLEGFNE